MSDSPRPASDLTAALAPDLKRLETERRAVLARTGNVFAKLGIGGAIGLGIAGLLAAAGEGQIPAGVYLGVVAICLVAAAAIHFGMKRSKLRAFAVQYKQRVIGRIVEELYPSVRYRPHQGVSQATFANSRLHPHSPDRYHAEDGFRGSIGETDVHLSEVKAQYRQTTTDSKGRTRTRYVTYFRGIFLVADFHKEFNGTVRVLPDQAERLLGRFGRALQGFKPFSSEKLIYLEDPEFEQQFVVYGSDDVEARYLLSTSMARRILDLKEAWNAEVRVSLLGSNIHVAISHKRDLFEPDVKSPVDDEAHVLKLVREIRSCLGIVDDLNLNTRIWSKE